MLTESSSKQVLQCSREWLWYLYPFWLFGYRASETVYCLATACEHSEIGNAFLVRVDAPALCSECETDR